MEAIEVQSLADYFVMEEEPNFSFQIDTSTFSAEDFNLFISSLEKTYSGRQLSPIVDQEDDDSEEDSLYDRIESIKESSISDYGGTSSEDVYSTSSSSLESLPISRSDTSSSPVVQELSIISTRPSLMNIFTYFDQDITVMSGDDSFNDSIEEPIIKDFPKITAPIKRKVPSPKKAPIPRQSSAIKNPLRELDKNTLAEPQPVTPGRLNKNLLKIFESETQPPNNAKKAPNPSKLQTLQQQRQQIPLPRKAPIIRNKIDQLDESRKKVDNDAIVDHDGLKLQAANETPPVETTAARASSTVKIVNATRKVDSPRPILSSNPNSAKSVHHDRDRDKCFVRNINDLFLHYRTQQLETSRLDHQHQVQQAIQQLDKSESSEPLKSMEDQLDPAKPTRKKTPEETAQQIHFRLQNQTYRVQMRTLIDTQNFVHMTAANRNQLFHLDKIFNRSSLSLIHMVLSLIRENVMMGDRVSVELQTTDYNRFVETMSEGSYGIDSMATSTIRENCVAVEILAVDDPAVATTTSSSGSGSKSIKIVILFVIETNDESTQKKQLDAGDDKASRQHLDSDFQITVRMRFEPPENELQKSHETGTNLSEHQLRVQASLQRLNIPDWYKQYSGKDGAHNTSVGSASGGGAAGAGGILRKRNSDVGRWTGLSSKTTSLSSLGSHRSDRSPVMLSPSAHSHHGGQTGFSRWSTSHLNSNQTSPSVSTRGSFTRGGLNASVISGYSTASTTAGATGVPVGGNSAIRNSFRQPYLGWRSQEKLAQPRTPAERLASSLLSQQKQQQHQQHYHQQQQHQHQQKVEPVVTPEIQSSIKEVTSAIVHYVNDQTNRHSRSRSTSPSQRCWLESSFVGTKPLDSPQTPMLDGNSSSGQVVVLQQSQQITISSSSNSSTMVAGDHYRYNAGRLNGVVTPSVPTFSLPPDHLQSPGSATLEDVLASLLGLPTDTHRSSVDSANSSLTPTAVSSNHTLQIETVQTRRRSEGDAGRRRNDSGGSVAVSSAASSSKDAHSRRVSLDSCDATNKSHGEPLKCRYPKCDATATIAEAKKSYKSCHNCSHLYCSRECRRAHWERHRKACLHSRISALCRVVLSTCKDDPDTLRHLSLLARRGYLSQGRGVVRILFRSPENADSFMKQGFQCLGEVAYVRWPDLLPSEMGPELYSELLKLSTEYKPDSKMLIYVAICVVSEAPGNATAPVKWERQLVSRCAKLKLCKSVINEINNSPIDKQVPKKESANDVLILSFNILAKTTQKSRELVSQNIQNILRQRGVILRKHYPEVFQRLSTFVEGSIDRFLPVTVHPRDNVTGRPFVCIIMPNYGDSEKLQFPISENSDDDRVVTIDVGTELGGDVADTGSNQ